MTAPDGGWGWVVVGSSFSIYCILGSIERGYGVWYVEILDRYDASSALSEWLIGLHCALRLLMFPVNTLLYSRLSLRCLGFCGGVVLGSSLFACAFIESFSLLFVVFGVLGGCAASFLQYVGQVVLVEYFEERKAIAYGIASSGSGLGGLFMSPFLSYSFTHFSYFESITFLAGIALQMNIACALCFPVYELETSETRPLLSGSPKNSRSGAPLLRYSPRRVRVRKAQGRRLFELDLLCNPLMWLYMVIGLFFTTGTFSILQFVVHFAVTRGETLESASLLLTGTGFVESLCRAVAGGLLNLSALKHAVLPAWNLCTTITSICALLITFCFGFWQFLPVVILCAGCLTLVNGFTPLAMGKVFEKEAFGAAFSLFSYGMGIGVLCGAYLAGYLKDATDSYEQSYYIMAGMTFVASLLMWTAYVMVLRARKTRKYRVYLSLKK